MNTYALCCLLLASSLGTNDQILDGESGLHVRTTTATSFSYRTEALNPAGLAGDGDITNLELHLPGASPHGFQMQNARLAAFGKLNDKWGGYAHVALSKGKATWEGFLDTELITGLRLRLGRWIQDTGPISGKRLPGTNFADRTYGGTAFFGGALVETGLRLRYALPFAETLPMVLSVSALEGANSISFAAGTGKEANDLFTHMLYLVNFSADLGALWDGDLTVGGFFGSGSNWTGNEVGARHITNIIGFNISSKHNVGAYQIEEKLELILRNFSVPKALNAMDSIATEVVVTRDNWQLGARFDALGMITPEPPPTAPDTLPTRISVAGTYRVAAQTFLRLQYNHRNDTPDSDTAHEVMLQGVFGLGGTFGKGAASAPKPTAAPKPSPEKEAPKSSDGADSESLSQAAAECQKVLNYINSIQAK